MDKTVYKLLFVIGLVRLTSGSTCSDLPNQKTTSTVLDKKARISSFFSPKFCLVVDAQIDAADLHGKDSHDRKNAIVYWADCSKVPDNATAPFDLNAKNKKVVAAEFRHVFVKKNGKTKTDFSMLKLAKFLKEDRCLSVAGFSDISKGVRLQLARCDKSNDKMRFASDGAGLWVYKNKKTTQWCLLPPGKVGDTAKVGACVRSLLGGKKAKGQKKVNGGFTNWSKWTACSVTCSNGTQTQSRTCTNPAPAYGGANCTGLTKNLQSCSTGVKCEVNGGFTEWSNWTACSVTCGNGTQTQSRTCTNPAPAYGGTNCTGLTQKSQSCSTVPCKVNGRFTDWSTTKTCSAVCGNGTQILSRTCTNPAPAYGGTNCTGATTISQSYFTGVNCEDIPSYNSATGLFNPMLNSSKLVTTFFSIPYVSDFKCKNQFGSQWSLTHCGSYFSISNFKNAIPPSAASDYSLLFGITTGDLSKNQEVGIQFAIGDRKMVRIKFGAGTETDNCFIQLKHVGSLWTATNNVLSGQYHMDQCAVPTLRSSIFHVKSHDTIKLTAKRTAGRGPCAIVLYSMKVIDYST